MYENETVILVNSLVERMDTLGVESLYFSTDGASLTYWRIGNSGENVALPWTIFHVEAQIDIKRRRQVDGGDLRVGVEQLRQWVAAKQKYSKGAA